MKKAIKKIVGKYTRKTVIGALSLAIALWLFTALNEEYTEKIDIPLQLTLPDSRAIESELPSHITVEARGKGWNLFSLVFFNSKKNCNLDLSDINITDSIYQITRSQLVAGINEFKNVQPTNVFPEFITMKTGRNESKVIPLRNKVAVLPDPNFILVNQIELEPDSITIIGNHKRIREIDVWHTEELVFKGVREDLNENVGLMDSLSRIIEIHPENINLYANIQMIADVSYNDIELEIIGGKLPQNYAIYPERFDVVASGGIEQLKLLSRKNISISVDLSDILNSTTGVIVPKIQTPANISIKIIEPEIIYVFKRQEIENLHKITRY